MQLLSNILSKTPKLNILIYIYGTEEEREDVENYKIPPNTVVIATNIAGRGANILPYKFVAALGGMHVIVTYFPDSYRVLMQALARAARCGDMGSAQLIFINKDANICDNIQCLNELRDEREEEKLKVEEHCNIPNLLLQDEYGQKGRDFMLNLQSHTGYYIDLSLRELPKKLNYNQIYLSSINDTGIFLSVLQNNNHLFQKDISDNLFALDTKGYEHIKDILYDHESKHYYTKKDFDLIHYIYANYSFFNLQTSIVENVESIYQNLIISCNVKCSVKDEKNKLTSNSCIKEGDCSINQYFAEERLDYLTNYLPSLNIFNRTKIELQNFKYALWQEYIEQFHYQTELAQVRAHFEMWLYRQQALFDSFEQNCNPYETEKIEPLLSDLKSNLSISFNNFAQDMKSKFKSISLFNNPRFMQDKALQYHDLYFSEFNKLNYKNNLNFLDFIFRPTINPELMNKAFEYIDQAIGLDMREAWSQFNVRSIIRVQKAFNTENLRNFDESTAQRCAQIKQEVVDDHYNGMDLGMSYKEAYDASYAALSVSNQLNVSLDLFKQYAIIRGIFDVFINGTRDAANFVIEQANDPKKCLMLSSTLTAYDLADKLNSTQIILDAALALNSSTILKNNFLELDSGLVKSVAGKLQQEFGFTVPVYTTYILQEDDDDDIFGKIFTGIFAVAQIVAGFAVIATFGGAGAFFANSIGLSMIMSGLGDMVMIADSIINNYPIDLDNYFKSKAISYAVIIITACIMHGLEIDVLGEKALGEGVKAFGETGIVQKAIIFKHALTMQAVSTLAGYAANYGAKRITESNQGDANGDSERMSQEIVNQYNEQLFVIYLASQLLF